MMNTIQQNLEILKHKITISAKNCERDPRQICLLAVSKTKSVATMQQAIDAGQRLFGENYVQEAIDKINYFSTTSYADQLEWHFIGSLQSNKTRLVAEYFDWIHTVDRLRIAQRLNEQRPDNKPPLNLLIQINISGEQTKSGIPLEQLNELAANISKMPRVILRGLMIIPNPKNNEQDQLLLFKHVEHAFVNLKASYSSVNTLSMGMTDDMSIAIAAGSTLIRIGRAIFGARD